MFIHLWERTTTRKLFQTILFVACLMMQESRALADATTVPNAGRIPIGDIGALEGGAMIARTDDGAATWYNPAGLVRANRPSISSNASLYEVNSITIGSGNDAERSNTFNIVPSFIGSVGFFTKDSAHPRTAWGFSIAIPVNWKSMAAAETVKGTEGTDLSYGRFSSAAELRTLVPSIGAAYAVSDMLSIGAAAHLLYTSEYQQYSLFERHDADTWFGGQSFVQDSHSWQGQLSLGASWRPLKAIDIGVIVKTPSVEISNRTLMYYHSSYYYGTETESEYADVNDLSYKVKRPAEFGAGVAYKQEAFGFEADAVYRMRIRPYSQYDGDMDISVMTYDSNGNQAMSQRSQTFVKSEDKAIVNVRIGGYVAATDAVKWHVGAFTDKSTMKKSVYYDYAGYYQKVDLYGATTGISVTDRNSTVGIGFSYTWSGPMSSQVYDIATSDYAHKPGNIQIFGFILTGKYFF